MSSSTRIWQEEKGKSIFRFQTESVKVHNFFAQRKDVKLIAWGVNLNLWIYLGEFESIWKAGEIAEMALNDKYEANR